MTHYSVAEAKNNLPKLLDRVLAGEEVVITRRGTAIVRLSPAVERERGRSIDVEALKRRRVMPKAGPIDTLKALEEMRKEQPW